MEISHKLFLSISSIKLQWSLIWWSEVKVSVLREHTYINIFPVIERNQILKFVGSTENYLPKWMNPLCMTIWKVDSLPHGNQKRHRIRVGKKNSAWTHTHTHTKTTKRKAYNINLVDYHKFVFMGQLCSRWQLSIQTRAHWNELDEQIAFVLNYVSAYE